MCVGGYLAVQQHVDSAQLGSVRDRLCVRFTECINVYE